MTVPPLLRAAVPMAVATLVAALVVVVAWRVLPERVVLVHLSDGGGPAMAASRADLCLVVGGALAGLVATWLVAAAFFAWTPARHLVVPHAAFWKARPNRREMRLRWARWVARAFAAGCWYLAATTVLAMASQGDGPLAAWWLPLALSGAYLLVLLCGAVAMVTVGFRPEHEPERVPAVGTRAAAGRAAPGAAAGAPAPAPPSRAGPAPRAAPPAPFASSAPADRGARARAPGGARPARPAAGRDTGAGEKKGPPRPYQPRPHQGGGPRRG